MALFVKFAPYNVYTISNLVNKTVRFSTVYDFNDFNELRYIGPIKDQLNGRGKSLIEAILQDSSEFDRMFDKSVESGVYSSGGLEVLRGRTYDSLENWDCPVFFEYLAYCSVGIFCVSHLSVFNDDSAQLMFAHYADNLRGVALIYELDPFPQNVCYNSDHWCDATTQDDFFKWHKGDFSGEMRSFKTKSSKWNYENEHRLFDRPGTHSTSENMVLKAIVYTTRFQREHIMTLERIREIHYNNELKLIEIRRNHSTPEFAFNFEHDKPLNQESIIGLINS